MSAIYAKGRGQFWLNDEQWPRVDPYSLMVVKAVEAEEQSWAA